MIPKSDRFRHSRPTPRFRAAVLASALACAILCAPSLHAAPALRGAPDKARIHADYQAGDFDKVVLAAEAFLATGKACSPADSVFLEKHLAVVYAADPATRERGRYHMLRMLDLDPRADLLDMFVGEEVDGIFEKIRKESALRNPASSGRYGRSGVSPPGNFARPGPASRQATRPASRSASRSAAAAPARPVALPAAAGAPVSALRSDPSPRLKAWNLGPAPRSRSSLPAAAPAEARTSLGSWHLAPTAYDNPPSARDAVRPAPSSVPRAADAPLPDPHPLSVRPAATPAPSAQAAPGDTTARTVSKPKWKERGFWIGSGAAVAVVGLTVYFAGGQQWNDPGGRSKVYGVPAKPTP